MSDIQHKRDVQKPEFDMHEIPTPGNKKWNELENRWRYEEDMRIHLYEALDRAEGISEAERILWDEVIKALYNLAISRYKEHGFPVHVH